MLFWLLSNVELRRKVMWRRDAVLDYMLLFVSLVGSSREDATLPAWACILSSLTSSRHFLFYVNLKNVLCSHRCCAPGRGRLDFRFRIKRDHCYTFPMSICSVVVFIVV